MARTGTTSTKLTCGDKTHQKFIDKLAIFKEGLTHGMDSITSIHEQTLESSDKYTEIVSMSQEFERTTLYEIIRNSDNETIRTEAFGRLKELDRIKEEEIKNHNEFLQTERDKSHKNIIGSVLCLAVAGGLINNKQVRQMTGKAVTKISKNLLMNK